MICILYSKIGHFLSNLLHTHPPTQFIYTPYKSPSLCLKLKDRTHSANFIHRHSHTLCLILTLNRLISNALHNDVKSHEDRQKRKVTMICGYNKKRKLKNVLKILVVFLITDASQCFANISHTRSLPPRQFTMRNRRVKYNLYHIVELKRIPIGIKMTTIYTIIIAVAQK